MFLIKKHGLNAIFVSPTLIINEQTLGVAKNILGTDWYIGIKDSSGVLDSFSFEDWKNAINNNKKYLIITTYQSISHVNELLIKHNVNLDMIIYDEAHHTCVVNASKKSGFKNSLDMFPNSRKLFMTATEKIVDYDKNDNISGIYSMSDENIYGKTIVTKTFRDGVTEGIVCDYIMAIASVNNPCEVIKQAQAELGLHHTLVYVDRCPKGKQLCNEFNSNDIKAFYLDGTFKHDKRNETIRQFSLEPRAVLISVRVLGEGISLPQVDSVYFVDKRSSLLI